AEVRALEARLQATQAPAPASLAAPSSVALAAGRSVAGAGPTPSALDPSTSLPAVSGVIGKLDLAVGEADGRMAFASSQSLAAPLSHSFGLQLDAMEGFGEHDAYGGAAAQAFWRDPSKGLLGVYGSVSFDERFSSALIGGPATAVSLERFGAAAALYRGR